MRPVCETCGATCTRMGWRGPAAIFTCSNTDCPDFGKKHYSLTEAVESRLPDRKENTNEHHLG